MQQKNLLIEERDDVEDELVALAGTGDARWTAKLMDKVEANPTWPDLRFQLARQYIVQGRFDEAMHELDSALAINPHFVSALRLKTRVLTDRGELRAALQVCRRLNSIDPNDAENFLAEATLHARLGDCSAAISAARNAISLDKSCVEAHVLISEQYLKLDDLRLARRHLETACETRKQNDLYYLLALVCLKEQDHPAAESALQQAIDLDPSNLNASVRLTMLKLAEGNYPEAYRVLTDAIIHHPRFPDLHYGLARICLLMGRNDEAYKLMTVALELNPEYAEVRRELGFLCNGSNINEAAHHAECSVDVNPFNEQAIINLGYIYSRQGDRDRAIEVLESAIDRSPDSWRFLKTLSILNLQQRSFPKAKLAFDAATQINPELGTIDRSLRIAFKDDSLFEEERASLVARYVTPAEQPTLNHQLGRLHVDFHRENQAVQYFRQSLDDGCLPELNSIALSILYGNRTDFVMAIRWIEDLKLTGFIENIRRLLLGLFHANSGEHETSTRFYQQVMNDSPLLFHSLNGLGVCFREREELEDMLDDYLDYSRYNEQNAPLYRRIGLAYANKGMLVEARWNFDRATILDPADGHAFHSLGLLAMLSIDHEEAIRCFKIATEREPDWALPQLSLALSYLELGDQFNAVLSLQRYIFLEQTVCWREIAEKINAGLQETLGA